MTITSFTIYIMITQICYRKKKNDKKLTELSFTVIQFKGKLLYFHANFMQKKKKEKNLKLSKNHL